MGINFKRPNKYELNIDLTNYTHEIIKRFNKEKIRYTDTPIVPGLKLKKANIEPNKAIILNYQKEIGVLLYLTLKTRPNITNTVLLYSRYMSKPNNTHIKVLNRI